jgi:UDP-glucuronate decarboxylase
MMGQDGFIGPVNLGNPEEFTMRQLAEQVLALTGSASPIEQRPLPLDDPRVRRPDISLARARLGWEPTVPLSSGLPPTIEWFRRTLTNGEPRG